MCWKCGKNITEQEPVERTAECSLCGTDLHSCRNCVFYMPGSQYECHETIDDPVSDKERNNFCDFFKVKRNFSSPGAAVCDARTAFNNLFGE